ncbi:MULTISPECIES: hypothetical protein [unclassified Bartonella]|uniref:hypothetical protein n=3 Tax=unclassified Bartonella TaxID=2645622 RepID=UPI0035D03B8D
MSNRNKFVTINVEKCLLDIVLLPAIECNVYLRLRLQMLYTGEPLINNSQGFSYLTKCSVKRFEKALDYLLRVGVIIRLEDGRLWSSQVEEELNNFNEDLNNNKEQEGKYVN